MPSVRSFRAAPPPHSRALPSAATEHTRVTIENRNYRACLAMQEPLAQPRKARRILAGAHDEQRAARDGGEDLEVRAAFGGRRIDEHDAEGPRRSLQEIHQPRPAEELSGSSRRVPATRTARFSRQAASCTGRSSSRSARPCSFFSRKARCTEGERRFPSTSSVRSPICARSSASCTATLLRPSPFPALTIGSTLRRS